MLIFCGIVLLHFCTTFSACIYFTFLPAVCRHEAVRIIHEAESLGMVDSEYMWIASALTYNISTIQPTMLPLGMIGT